LRILKWVTHFRFCIAVLCSDFTWAVGFAAYTRWAHVGRVELAHACWVSRAGLITKDQLVTKLEAFMRRGSTRIVFAGKFTAKKGVLEAVEICRGLAAHGHEITLDLFGKGQLGSETTQAIQSASVEFPVTLHGWIPYGSQFWSQLRKYDMILVPGFGHEEPRIIYDAWANGVVVVVYPNKTTTRIVRDRVTGLVPAEADIDSATNKILQALPDREVLARIALCSRDAVEGLTIEHSAQKFAELVMASLRRVTRVTRE